MAVCMMLTGCPDSKPKAPLTEAEVVGYYDGNLSHDGVNRPASVYIYDPGEVADLGMSGSTLEGVETGSAFAQWQGVGNYSQGRLAVAPLYVNIGGAECVVLAPTGVVFSEGECSFAFQADTLGLWTFEGTKVN